MMTPDQRQKLERLESLAKNAESERGLIEAALDVVRVMKEPEVPKKVTREEIENTQVRFGSYGSAHADLLQRILNHGYDDGKPEITRATLRLAWDGHVHPLINYKSLNAATSEAWAFNNLCADLGLPDEGV